MDAVGGIDLGGREIRHDIYTLEKAAGEVFEVFDFANAIHLVDDFVEHRLDFLVRLLSKERTLNFEAAFVPQKFLAIKLRDVFLSGGFSFHID